MSSKLTGIEEAEAMGLKVDNGDDVETRQVVVPAAAVRNNRLVGSQFFVMPIEIADSRRLPMSRLVAVSSLSDCPFE